jgi:hypothetical protein
MAGANQSFSLIARGVTITSSSQTAYLARVRIETGNILRLYIIRKLAGVETPIGSAHSISLPQGYTPGQKIWCEVSVLDTNPTTLGAKMWLDGSSEPSLYQVQGTDTTSELQAAGTVGINRTVISYNDYPTEPQQNSNDSRSDKFAERKCQIVAVMEKIKGFADTFVQRCETCL